MPRLVKAATGQRGVALPNGKVIAANQTSVLSDAHWAAVSALVTAGTLLDMGASTAAPDVPQSNEKDPVAGSALEAFKAEAKATFGLRPDLVSRLQTPFLVSHRGGPLVYPEHSMEGYRASAAAGFPIEPDIERLADGTLVCLHDGTVDRTMTGTGNVGSFTLAQWKSMRIKDPAATFVYPGTAKAIPVTWREVVDEFGGRHLLMPEVKNSAARDALLDDVIARGLQRAVIVQSFNYADVKEAARRGVTALYLNDAPPVSTMVADGIGFVGASTSLSQANLDAAKAAGLKVIIYTVTTKAVADAQFARGADGVFSDDPWTNRGAPFPISESDLFRAGVKWPGMNSALCSEKPRLLGRELIYNFTSQGYGSLTTEPWSGLVSTASGKLRVRATIRHGWNTANANRWGSIYVGTLPAGAAGYDDNSGGVAGQFGYHCLFRRDGSMNVYTVNPAGGPNQIGSTATVTADNVGKEFVHMVEVEINATDITVRNLTLGTSTVIADTTRRGTNQHVALNTNGQTTGFSDVSIVKI